MTLTLGAAHVCSVPTVFTIARPVGLSVHLTGIPGYVPRDVGSPAEYHRLGRINLGNSLGYQLHQELATSPQLIYPIAPEFTLLSVNMVQGVVVTIDEIASSTSLMPAADPWDRSPAAFQAQGKQLVTTQTSATMWTLTVPAGRKALITSAECALVRIAPFTTAGWNCQVYMMLNGLLLLEIADYGVAMPLRDRATLSPGGLLLNAGDTLSASYVSGSTGGTHSFEATASGYTFAA